MRKIILLLATLGVVAASPSFARGYRYLHIRYRHVYHRAGFAEARRLILGRGLLTPDQLACAEFIPGHKATGHVIQISVVRRPSCPAEAAPPFLFDLYIDNTSGSYQWTPEERETLKEVPYLSDLGLARQ